MSTTPTTDHVSADARFTGMWSEINTRISIRDHALWNYVVASGVLLGISLTHEEHTWVALFVPLIALVSVILFAFHDGYIAYETKFLAALTAADQRGVLDWFEDDNSSGVFKRQHWLMAAQLVSLIVPSVVAMVVAYPTEELLSHCTVELRYWLFYGLSLLVVLVVAGLAVWTWFTHFLIVRDLHRKLPPGPSR